MSQRLVIETLSPINAQRVVTARKTEAYVVTPQSRLFVFSMGNQIRLDQRMLLASLEDQDKRKDVYLPFLHGQIGEMSEFIRYADDLLNIDYSRPHKAISPRKSGEMVERFETCFGGLIRLVGPTMLLP